MFQEIGGLHISLPSTREIALSRNFKANRKLVFEAFTKPHLVKRWLAGPPGWDFAVCDIDLTIGGMYRYVWRREADQAESVMDGIFHDIVPERLVASEMFDDTLGAGRIFDTTVLVDHGTTTVLKLAALYETQVARDTILQSETLKGMADGYDRLDALLNVQAQWAF